MERGVVFSACELLKTEDGKASVQVNGLVN